VCETPLEYPGELGQLRDANGLMSDSAALRERMEEDGYLLIRGFHPRREVLRARQYLLEQMEQRGIRAGQHREMQEVAKSEPLMSLLESPRLFQFFERYFDEPALTFSEKWLRAVSNGGFTGIHY